MKALKIILGFTLFLCVAQAENTALAFTAILCAFGWYFYERDKKTA